MSVLNAQSGIFTVELLTFGLVAGYIIYKWNTTPSFGDSLSNLGNEIEEGASNLWSEASQGASDLWNSLENSFGPGYNAPPHVQTTLQPPPDKIGSKNPPPTQIGMEEGYVPPPAPHYETPPTTYDGPTDSNGVPPGISPEVLQQIQQYEQATGRPNPSAPAPTPAPSAPVPVPTPTAAPTQVTAPPSVPRPTNPALTTQPTLPESRGPGYAEEGRNAHNQALMNRSLTRTIPSNIQYDLYAY